MEHAEGPGASPKQRLEQWIGAYSDTILRVCFVILRDRQQAEDAMQDTFLKAWRHMARLDSPSGMGEKAWLLRIAINTCRDYRRSAWFRHTDMRGTPEDLPRAPETRAEDHALLSDVYELPEKYKQAILLYYYQEMTLDETARCLGVSRSAVHKRLSRAREMLKGRLTGRDFDE